MRTRASVRSLLGAVSLSVLACSPSGAGGSSSTQRQTTASSVDADGTSKAPPPSGATPAQQAESAASPEVHLGDLTKMCQSLHDDYGDGTLSDFFAGLEFSSSWGRALARRTRESTTPGRVLEAAAPRDESLPAPCRRLFDDLDDLE